uniref:Uncharacterized protein n=1 Tax=Lepeophtheirus salmonis TaxID=72036 RepID=A0A0K2TWB2_LEPSM
MKISFFFIKIIKGIIDKFFKKNHFKKVNKYHFTKKKKIYIYI